MSAVRTHAIDSGEHTAMLNGVRLWYKIVGVFHPGLAPLLFLHGGPGYNSYSFEQTVGSRIKQLDQVIYLDERGSGRSERPANRDYALPSMVDDVEALRVALGVSQMILMGHSFGGAVALEYARQYPLHVQRLVILDGATDMPAIFALWREELMTRSPEASRIVENGAPGIALREALASVDACRIAHATFALDMTIIGSINGAAFRSWQQFHSPRFEAMQQALDQRSGLENSGEIGGYYFGPDSTFPCYRFTDFEKISMPVLVMTGKYDGSIGASTMQSLAAHLPNARFDLFTQSAHFVYAEEPNKFVHDLAGFLRDQKAR